MILMFHSSTHIKFNLISTMAAPHGKERQEGQPYTTDLPKTLGDTEYDVIAEIQAGNDLESLQNNDDLPNPHENLTEEEAWEKFLSTAYERGSKKPMKAPLTALWGLLLSDADVAKLKVGYKSQSMDNKWDLLVEDPDENGGFSVHIFRNWLQEECYVLHVMVSDPPSDKDDGYDAGERSAYGAEI